MEAVAVIPGDRSRDPRSRTFRGDDPRTPGAAVSRGDNPRTPGKENKGRPES
ncbi:hypothetical protein GCM10010331_61750 [Streptomyces xanthochromogenes]|nr:hypothetical protein GCM10010331_61750 [Streptomyces xanthochromogenes]